MDFYGTLTYPYKEKHFFRYPDFDFQSEVSLSLDEIASILLKVTPGISITVRVFQFQVTWMPRIQFFPICTYLFHCIFIKTFLEILAKLSYMSYIFSENLPNFDPFPKNSIFTLY